MSFKEIKENCKTIGDVLELTKKELKLIYILEKAEQIARKYHKGQKRLYGEDFIIHPEAVANSFEDTEYKIVAWLHDILEDTDLEPEDLEEKGIPDNLISSIISITLIKGFDYKEYIIGIQEDEIAQAVKISDLKHNLLTLKHGSLRDKYKLALYILENKLK